MKKGIIIFLALVFLFPFCASQAAQDMSAEDFVNIAKKSIHEISVSDAKVLLEKGGHIFLDCREPKEFKMGHVPGAMNIPRGVVEFKVGKQIPDKNAKIITYCKFGGRGCLTCCTLCKMGYHNVVNLAGGWLAWEKAGYPVE
ncbi:MAG: rhodanese-like domain-containing protein [Desulfatiglandaceae bacterium]